MYSLTKEIVYDTLKEKFNDNLKMELSEVSFGSAGDRLTIIFEKPQNMTTFLHLFHTNMVLMFKGKNTFHVYLRDCITQPNEMFIGANSLEDVNFAYPADVVIANSKLDQVLMRGSLVPFLGNLTSSLPKIIIESSYLNKCLLDYDNESPGLKNVEIRFSDLRGVNIITGQIEFSRILHSRTKPLWPDESLPTERIFKESTDGEIIGCRITFSDIPTLTHSIRHVRLEHVNMAGYGGYLESVKPFVLSTLDGERLSGYLTADNEYMVSVGRATQIPGNTAQNLGVWKTNYIDKNQNQFTRAGNEGLYALFIMHRDAVRLTRSI